MGADTSIRADATGSGDGGTVVLWSEDYTGFYGNISALGGASGGNGGAVETSSHGNLQAFGQADTTVPAGNAGQWLLDPANITITGSTSNGAFDGGDSNGGDIIIGGGTSPTTVPAIATASHGVVFSNDVGLLGGGGDISVTGKGVGTGDGIVASSSNLTATTSGIGTITITALGDDGLWLGTGTIATAEGALRLHGDGTDATGGVGISAGTIDIYSTPGPITLSLTSVSA